MSGTSQRLASSRAANRETRAATLFLGPLARESQSFGEPHVNQLAGAASCQGSLRSGVFRQPRTPSSFKCSNVDAAFDLPSTTLRTTMRDLAFVARRRDCQYQETAGWIRFVPGHLILESTQEKEPISACPVLPPRRFLDDLLDERCLQLGKTTLHTERLDLRGIVEDVTESVRPQVAEKQQSVDAHLPKNPVWVEAEPRPPRPRSVRVPRARCSSRLRDQFAHLREHVII